MFTGAISLPTAVLQQQLAASQQLLADRHFILPHLTESTFQIERFAPLLPHCPRDVQVRFLRAAGAIADMAGIPDDAAFVYRERALRLARQLEDRDLICLCLDAYGSSANRRGAFDWAEPLLRQALALEVELNQGQMRYMARFSASAKSLTLTVY